MKNMEYKKIKEEMLDCARKIDEGLYYTIADSGVDIFGYKELQLNDREIDAIEEIIYNEHPDKEEIKAAKEVIDKKGYIVEEVCKNMDLKVDNIYRLVDNVQDCIEYECLEEYGEGYIAIQYIYKTAEKWGRLYLWYEYIFKNAKKFLLEKKQG